MPMSRPAVFAFGRSVWPYPSLGTRQWRMRSPSARISASVFFRTRSLKPLFQALNVERFTPPPPRLFQHGLDVHGLEDPVDRGRHGHAEARVLVGPLVHVGHGKGA